MPSHLLVGRVEGRSAGPVVVTHGGAPFVARWAVVGGVQRAQLLSRTAAAPFAARRAVVGGAQRAQLLSRTAAAPFAARRAVVGRAQRAQLLSRTAATPFANWQAVVGRVSGSSCCRAWRGLLSWLGDREIQQVQLLSRIAGDSLRSSTVSNQRTSAVPVVVAHDGSSLPESTVSNQQVQRIQLLSRTAATSFPIDRHGPASTGSPQRVQLLSRIPPPPFRIPDSRPSPIHQLLSRTVGTSSHLRRPKSRPQVETARETEVTEEPSSCCRSPSSPPFQSRAFGGFRTSPPGELVTESGHEGPLGALADPLVRPGFGAAVRYSQWPPPLAGRRALGCPGEIAPVLPRVRTTGSTQRASSFTVEANRVR
ncbi:hypothetical protein A4R44_07780 [Amycolatopsis sp. M39]|nr:hypothetical protein A4R44_07780 [Amycolatopsis sp. M39]